MGIKSTDDQQSYYYRGAVFKYKKFLEDSNGVSLFKIDPGYPGRKIDRRSKRQF